MNKDGRGEILAVDASGRLLMFAGRSDGGLGSSYQLGTGWGSMQVFGPGDLNGDGKSDILGITTSGDLFTLATYTKVIDSQPRSVIFAGVIRDQDTAHLQE